MLEKLFRKKAGDSRPLLILMKGHPGTGKSDIARHLARILRIPLADKDDARDQFEDVQLADLLMPDKAPPRLVNTLSYSIMWSIVERQLRNGLSCIVDSPLARREHFFEGKRLAEMYGANILVIETRPMDTDVWRTRLEERGKRIRGTKAGHRPCSWDELNLLLSNYSGCYNWTTDGSVELPYYLQVQTCQAETDKHQTVGIVAWCEREGLIPKTPVPEDL